jgi:hypothetical protein
VAASYALWSAGPFRVSRRRRRRRVARFHPPTSLQLPHRAPCKAGGNNLESPEEVGRSFIKFLYTGDIENAVLDKYIEKILCLGD